VPSTRQLVTKKGNFPGLDLGRDIPQPFFTAVGKVAACQIMAARKEQMEVRGDFEDTSQVEHRVGTNIAAALSLGENLPHRVS
jgi:hypothetical protein